MKNNMPTEPLYELLNNQLYKKGVSSPTETSYETDPDSLISGRIAGNVDFDGGYVESGNFRTGIEGWRISSDGTAEFQNLNIGQRVISLPTTANATEINSAITTVNASGGGEVRLAAGTYTLSTDIVMKTGVALVGSGLDLTIIDFNETNSTILADSSASPLSLRQFAIKGLTIRDSSSTGAIEILECAQFQIINVKTTSNDHFSLYIEDSSDYSVRDFRSSTDVDEIRIIHGANGTGGDTVFFFNVHSDNGFLIDNDAISAPECRMTFINCSDEFVFTAGIRPAKMTLIACEGPVSGFSPEVTLISHLSETGITDDKGYNIVRPWNNEPDEEAQTNLVANASGGNLLPGDVVILSSTAGAASVTTTTTAGDNKVIGMVLGDEEGGTFATSEAGYILRTGRTALLKVNGTTDIAVGDYLSTFTTAGIAAKASSGHTAFAIALEAYTTDDSSGIIDALLITPRYIA